MATQNHGQATLAKLSGHFIGAWRGTSDGADAHQVGVELVRLDLVNAFVNHPDFGIQFRRDERCQRCQRQRRITHGLFPDAAAMAVERAARSQRIDDESMSRTLRARQLTLVTVTGIPE